MNKETVQRQAYGRMSRIEDLYSDHVPIEASAYWRLNYLIAEGLRAYVGSYGLLPIHQGDANDGRHELGLGPLSEFERDTIQFLSEHIEEAEMSYQRRRLPSSARTI